MKSLVGIVIIIWLLVGVLAAWQRGYFGEERDVSCKTAGDTTLTVVAGPLNYLGVNPKIDCEDVQLPEPSE